MMPSKGRPSAIAPAVPRAGAGRFRIAFNDAWRGVTRNEIAWTLAIGLAFTVAHAYSFGSKFRSWPFLILPSEWAFIPHCLILLIVLRTAEHPQLASIPQWRRYAVAVPSAVLLLGLTAASWDFILFGSTIPQSFSGFVAVQLFLLTIMASIVYSSLLRSRRAQAAFDAAALQRAATARRVTAARLATQQAQVDPALLFSTLELVETLYERDPDAAERALAELIEFLRTALPKMDEEGSTLGREAHLARAFLGIVHARMGSRLDTRIEIPPEIDGASFPAMVLVPLVEHAVRHGLEPLPHGGRLEIRAAKKVDRLEVAVVHNGADDPDRTWLDPLHERVTGLYGDEARVSIDTAALGPCATVDLPYETAPAEPAAIPAMATTVTTGSAQ